MSARWSSAALAVALVGCDVAAGLDELPNADLAPGCSGTRLLRSFGDGVLDPIWSGSVDPTSTIVVGSRSTGQLSLTTTTAQRVTVGAVASLDLRGDAVSVGVVTTGGGEQPEIDLTAATDSSKVLRMTEAFGTLHFSASDGQTGGDVATLAYDPAAHRYWRIEDVSGEIRWETSSDDKQWVVRAKSRIEWVEYVTVSLAMSGPPTMTTTTTFDSINAPDPTGVVCRATALVDDFHGDTLAPTWEVPSGYVAPTVAGGQLLATIPPSVGMSGEAASSTIYDLRESAFTVHVASVPDIASDGTAYMNLTTIPLASISMTEARGVLGANVQQMGSVGTQQWDPTLTWWRLRGSKGVLYWEVSADGRQFTPYAQATGIPLDRIGVSLGVTGAQGNSAAFDHFNLPP